MQVYKLTNNINNKIYIGSTKYTAYDRFWSTRSGHVMEANHGNTRPLYEDMRKYGYDSFSIDVLYSDESCTREDLYDIEERYIEYYSNLVGWDNMYNLSKKRQGGCNPPKPRTSEEGNLGNRVKPVFLVESTRTIVEGRDELVEYVTSIYPHLTYTVIIKYVYYGKVSKANLSTLGSLGIQRLSSTKSSRSEYDKIISEYSSKGYSVI